MLVSNASCSAYVVFGAADLPSNEMCHVFGVVFLYLPSHQPHQLRQLLLEGGEGGKEGGREGGREGEREGGNV